MEQNDYIQKAKLSVIKAYERASETRRRWLKTTAPHSYDDPTYTVELYVLEGSPPKGYVLATKDVAIAIDCWFKVLKRYKKEDE